MRLNFSRKLFVIGLLAAPAALTGAPQAPPAAAPAPAAQQPADAVPPADDAPRFPAGVELVTVDVVVTDRKGNPVPDLPKDAFTVQEDGTAQSIASFEAVKVPPVASVITPEKPRVSTNTVPIARTGRSFVIVFDDIHLAPFQAHRAKAAVAEFLKAGVREGDLVTLIATGGGVWWSTRMEAGRDELIALLKRLDGRLMPQAGMDRMSDYEAMRIHVYHDVQVEQRVSRRFETYGVSNRAGMGDSQNPMYADGDPMVRGRASEVYFQSVSRNRITLEVLERSLNALAASRGRKSLILVSEGFIYDPNLDEFKRVTQASRRSNVAMYFLDTRGLGGMPSYTSAEFGPAIDTQDIGAAFVENLEASEGAESLAADTGGFSVKNTNDLVGGIKRIAEESQSYYLVGYNSSNTARDGRFRKIQVKVAGKGLKVRYRKGYYAPLDGAKVADKRGSDPQIQAALDSPYEQDDVPIRMTSYVMGETLLGKASVLVAADVDVTKFGFDEKEGRLHDTLEYLMVVAHRESGEFFRYDQKVEMKLRPETHERLKKSWYGVVKDFELAPGGYQAKIVVRDKNKHQVGTVVHEFEVPDLTAFRVSTPILSDVVRPSEDNQNVPQPMLLARRTFGAGATLYASFEVHGAAKDKKTGMPMVSAGYVIRRREGGVVTQSAPTLITPTSLGKVSRLIGAPLQGGPGDYELVITFNDTVAGKTLEVREPFSVAPGEAPPAG